VSTTLGGDAIFLFSSPKHKPNNQQAERKFAGTKRNNISFGKKKERSLSLLGIEP
jgi:hypothetical protein